MEKVDIAIVGAGVIGLAVARELSLSYKDILVIEKNPSFGQETSSRNSEVIHAGIYYPKTSLKTNSCIEGNKLLYEFCLKYNIAHKKIGKLIVAIDKEEVPDLERLFRQGRENGVVNLKLISKNEIKNLEPNIVAEAAIYSPSTGILDSHSFMRTLLSQFEARGAQVAYNTELKAIVKIKEGLELTVEDKREGSFKFLSRLLINCAGLNCDKVAVMAGLEKEEYRLKYSKGDYFRVQNNKARFLNHLVYPVPKESRSGLGIHATLDLGSSLRLGPDDEYVDKINYNVEAKKAGIFYESSKKFLPFIELEDLNPDIAGIRPKLQGPREPFCDFIVQEESDNGMSGMINLIGIESPGLTASLSLAKRVKEITEKII